jgi:leader peptidase (prepilin peptidase) / N-methyltransferase
MSALHVAAGAALGAALGYGGARLAPRWLERAPKSWGPYAAAAANGLLAGLLAAGHPLDRYFWQQLFFISLLVAASYVDLHERIIPNELVLAGLGVGAVMLLVIPYPEKSWLQALGGAGLGFGFLLLLAVLVRGGMGLGDVKLAAVIGLFLGYPWVGMGLMLAFLAGGLAGALLILLRVVGRKDVIPFGPYLALGAALTVIYGARLWMWYSGVY